MYLRILLIIIVSFLGINIYGQNLEDVKQEIFSKLRDRRCNMAIVKCSCPDAKEMKAYIEALLEVGIGKDDIFVRVAKKFSLDLILDEQIKETIKQKLIIEAGDRRPQIFVDSESFSFGKVTKSKGKIKKVFKLSNKGLSDLVITGLKTSCGCVTTALGENKFFGSEGTPSDWKKNISPGKVINLEVVVDLNHSSIKKGKIIREIFISSNDPVRNRISLRLEFDVGE